MLVSNAETGELEALLDAGAVTALRTGAAAVLAAETLGRADARSAAVIGAGVNGRAAARTFLARGRARRDLGRRRGACRGGGRRARLPRSRRRSRTALARRPRRHRHARPRGALRGGLAQPGQHVSLMGADGPGKAEIAAAELARTRVFCDDWEQASHGGELAHAVEGGLARRESEVDRSAPCSPATRQAGASDDEITTFDSTGLAIQDLAIAIAALANTPSGVARIEL